MNPLQGPQLRSPSRISWVSAAGREGRRRSSSVAIGCGLAGIAVLLASCSSTPTSHGVGASATVVGAPGGISSASKTAASALEQAVTKTTAYRTAAVNVSDALSGDYLAGLSPADSPVGGVGTYEFLDKTGSSGIGTLRMNLPLIGDSSVIVDGTDLYTAPTVKENGALNLGKPWIKYDLKYLAESSNGGGGTGQMTESLWGSMTQPLTYLNALVPGTAQQIGPSSVNGVEATEYKAVVDANKVIEHGSVVQRYAISQLVLGSASTTFPVNVWLDSKGRVTKIQYSISLGTGDSTAGSATTSTSDASGGIAGTSAANPAAANPTGTDSTGANPPGTNSTGTANPVMALSGTQDVTVSLTDFGVPVQVIPPSAGSYTDFSQFLVTSAAKGTPNTLFFGRYVG